ncbi:MAG: hypothetical protein EXS64_21355 [Candidatus Latescibacteria bacterium]|nr:hypothetical protein [Candidatus Latescibacterota bacterium]
MTRGGGETRWRRCFTERQGSGETRNPKPESRLFPDSGYAVLRAERPEAYLLLKYGPHGGGHGHPDKLSLILHACGPRSRPTSERRATGSG